jgi:hypothetical protein
VRVTSAFKMVWAGEGKGWATLDRFFSEQGSDLEAESGLTRYIDGDLAADEAAAFWDRWCACCAADRPPCCCHTRRCLSDHLQRLTTVAFGRPPDPTRCAGDDDSPAVLAAGISRADA